jgi:hypothetical protein
MKLWTPGWQPYQKISRAPLGEYFAEKRGEWSDTLHSPRYNFGNSAAFFPCLEWPPEAMLFPP